MDEPSQSKAPNVRSSIPGQTFVLVVSALALAALIWQAIARPRLHTPSGPEAGSVVWPDMRVGLNSASPAEFTVLPGIGEKLALRIVEDREANGPFTSLEDLQRVPGIGPVTLERIKELVVVD